MSTLQYRVGTLRAAGLEAKWGRTSNRGPAIFARDPQSRHRHLRTSWWMVDAETWKRMERYGIREGFEAQNLLGDFFSIPA